MDNTLNGEKLERRVDWLDNEVRNDKTVIAALQSKIENLDTENSALRIRLTDMESEITRLNTILARQEQFDQEINDLRKTMKRQVEEFISIAHDEKLVSEKNAHEIGDLKSDTNSLRKNIQEYEGIFELVEERKEEDNRLSRLIEEVKAQVSEIGRFEEDFKRSLRMIEENRRQDVKRLTDIQGEVASVRKRQDETRNKQDLVGDNMRKLELRIKNLLEAESERRESQTAFTEKINLAQVDQERTFKEWAERFEKMEQITSGIEEQISGLEDTHRSVKKSQDALDEVTQRFDRRINEITEVQRLNEDRFRQEWTTFKSDYQKRWSNYTLAQEEQHREMNKGLEGMGERVLKLEDMLDEVRDNIQYLGQNELQHMQALLNVFRESVDTYNNFFKE